ncbi:hypothetical protein, partial [Gimesia sp.]
RDHARSEETIRLFSSGVIWQTQPDSHGDGESQGQPAGHERLSLETHVQVWAGEKATGRAISPLATQKSGQKVTRSVMKVRMVKRNI